MRRPSVGVWPAVERNRRERLFDALEQAFGVGITGCYTPDFEGFDAAVLFAAAPRPTCPSLKYEMAAPEPGRSAVRLAEEPPVDRRLGGRRFREDATPVPLRASASERVLAAHDLGPVWTAEGRHCRASATPRELDPEETLRRRLRVGCFLGLLPLVHLLRLVTTPERGDAELRPRACLILDDPNLRRPTYGHVNFEQLANRAAAGGYHVTFASIPLDYGRVHPRLRELFRTHDGQVSLAVHGNNHSRGELSRPRDEAQALALGAQALRRVAVLEQRTGLQVARVMCAPHDVCSRVTARALFRLGYDGLVKEPLGRMDEAGPNAEGRLAGWEPATTLAGLPVLPRYRFHIDDDELAFNYYLNLPFLLFGHQSDLAGSPEVLDAAADRINRIARCDWLPLGQLSRATAGQRTACPDPVSPREVPSPKRSIWPNVRRLLTESRDRLSPLLRSPVRTDEVAG
jgi:hypothetical protein